MIAISIYLISYSTLAWYRFSLALALFFALLPVYLIRFSIGPIPTTLLECMFGVLFIVWLLNNSKRAQFILSHISRLISHVSYHVSCITKQHRLLMIGIGLFLSGATISIVTAVDLRAALGIWKAFYVEPIIMFFIIMSTIKTKKDIDRIIISLIGLALITSLLAIYQHFTGWMVPYAFWENGASYRVTAWYGFPNGVGLFLAPLLPLMLYSAHEVWMKYKQTRMENGKLRDMRYEIRDTQIPLSNHLSRISYFLSLISIPLTLLAITFAKSTGGLIGAAAGVGMLLLLWKKTRVPTVIIGAVALITLIFGLPTDHAIRKEILAQDRSGQIRVAIWHETLQLLRDKPFTGAGLASYQDRIVPYHQQVHGENIEIFHHPHNIFLTIWVNTGLLGIIGFCLILFWFFKTGLQTTSYKLQATLVASMVALLVTGLVDSPYIKNDLAMLFWLLPSLLIVAISQQKSHKII